MSGMMMLARGSLSHVRNVARNEQQLLAVQSNPSSQVRPERKSPAPLGSSLASTLAAVSQTPRSTPLSFPSEPAPSLRVTSLPAVKGSAMAKPDLEDISLGFADKSSAEKPVASEPAPARSEKPVSKGLLRAIAFGKFLDKSKGKKECQAFTLYKEVQRLQRENKFPNIRANFRQDDKDCVLASRREGVIAMPPCKSELMQLSHFIDGLILLIKGPEVEYLRHKAETGECTEQEFVEAEIKLHFERMTQHSQLIKDIISKRNNIPEGMDLYEFDFGIEKELFAEMFRKSYQEIRERTKNAQLQQSLFDTLPKVPEI